MVPIPGTSQSGDVLDDGHEKILSKYVSPQRKQDDVWCVMQQSAITFEPMGTTTSPAYGKISLGRVNLFVVHLS